MIEAAERDGRLKPGGTVVEATAGNTGLGPGAGGARQGLSRRAGRARQDVDREGAAPEGARRRGAHHALGRRQGPPRLLPGPARRGWRARSPAPSSPTSSTTRPTRWRTRPAPAPRSGQQMRPRPRRDRRRRRLGRHADRPDALLPQRAAASSHSCSPIRRARSSPSTRAAARVGEAGSWAVEGIGEDFIPAIADLSRREARLLDPRRRKLRHRARAAARRRHPRRLVDRHAARRRAALLPRADDAEARRQLRLRHRHALPVEGLQRPVDGRPGPAARGAATATCAT